MLKTDRAKLGALNYLARKMTKENIENCMPDKVLVTNALISGIYSENILVQRATMDLLNSHFPLLKNDGFLSTEEKRAILDSLFRLFKRNDSTLTRRIWDYCQTGEQLASDEDFEIIKDEYIVPTLKEIFTAEISLTRLNSQERTQKMLEPLIITETLLEKENLGVFLLKDIAVSLIGFVESYKGDQEYGKIICEKFSGLLRAEIIVNYEKQICEALAYSLEESCIGEVDYILNIIHFYLTNFPLEASKSSQLLIPIIEILFTNIHRMQNSISLAFKIANLILKKIDIRLEIQDSFTCFNRFYIEFTKNPESSLKDIKEATHIAIELTKNGNLDLGWLTCIIEFIKNPQSIELSLIGIDTAIVLIQNNLDDCKSFISQELGGLDVKLFDFLWKFLDQKSKTKKIVKLIWKLQESTSFLRLNIKDKLIISSKNGPKEVPARIFTLKRLGVLWEITRKTDNDRLLHFLTNELIFLILDKLEDPHPSVRHAARDFMSKITPELSLIIDPLFESILNQCVYKIAPISYSFRKFKLLLSACGNFVYKKMDRMTVSSSIMDQWLEYRRNIVNAEEVESCTDLLTEICVNYLIAQIYNYKEREYQIAAGELIELILNYGSREQAYRSVFRILRSLKKIFEDKDGVMQLICLNILNQILYNCNIQSNPERCKNLLSTNFMSMFEDKFFLDGQNEFIRSHWVSFLIKSLDYIAEIVNTDMFIRMASVILAKLCALIDITENKDHLLQGITSYLHYGLCISKPEAFNLPDLSSLSVVRESFFEGMFKRLLWTDSLPILSASSRISQEMFKEFTRILETCLVYIDDYDCEDIKAKGVSVFTSVKGKPIEDRIVKDLLEPIMVTRTYELVKAAIAVWISRSAAEVDPVPKTDQDLIKILRILTALDTPLDVIIEAIYKYLIEDLKINSGNTRKNSGLMRNQETSVAHFIYSLFSFYSKEKFEEICKESRLV